MEDEDLEHRDKDLEPQKGAPGVDKARQKHPPPKFVFPFVAMSPAIGEIRDREQLSG